MDIQLTAILPLISSFLVLGLGVLIFSKDTKSKIKRIFLFTAFAISIWLFGTFMMFLAKTDAQAIFWDRFIYMGVVFIPALFYHFSLVFTKTKGHEKALIPSYFLSFVFLILSRTDYFVADLYRYSWGVHTQARIFHHIFLAYFVFLFVLAFIVFYRHYKRKDIDATQKTWAKYVFFAFAFLMVAGPTGFGPAYNISFYPILSYISGAVFGIIIGYAVIKHSLMNVKIIAVELFAGLIVLSTLTAIVLFPSPSKEVLAFQIFIFVGITFLSLLAIKATSREVQTLEGEVHQRTVELQKAKDIADQKATEATKKKEELEKFFKLTVGREMKMAELKKKIKDLEEKNND